MTHRAIHAFTIPFATMSAIVSLSVPGAASDAGPVARFDVVELRFAGPEVDVDAAADIELSVALRHDASGMVVTVPGFFDGDGDGGALGRVFAVRFAPDRVGRWTIAETRANQRELAGQRIGDGFECVASEHPGRWVADGPTYRRSDGSRPWIAGNTHYTFLSRRDDRGEIVGDPLDDVRANARFYKKLRFSLFGDRYPDPELKPFLDRDGRPSDDGRNSRRPNPRWFRERVDPVVAAAQRVDLICDLILCGPDAVGSRSTLLGDVRPWLRYVAARYGAYPNVWFCLANEWDIKEPSYDAATIRAHGDALRAWLPLGTPLSVHGKPPRWDSALSGDWNDHVIIQLKSKTLGEAADAIARERAFGKPVLNDENAYQGAGDGFSLGDVVEGALGTFLGGGYPTTGEKHGRKHGQYFWGGFDAREHDASERLLFLREYVDRHIAFAELAPSALEGTPFAAFPATCRLLARRGDEYVLGSTAAHGPLSIALEPGVWRVRQVDLLAMRERTIAPAASGTVGVRLPDSRAAFTHLRRVAERVDERPADLVLRGGNVITVDDEFRIASAVAVRAGEIIAVGTDDDALRFRGTATRVVDLAGRCVLPGLIDSHVHPGGASLHEHDHAIPEMETIAEVLDYVRARAEALADGEWIQVRQVFITRLREQRYPTRAELDAAAPHNPVLFSTGPDASLNSLALELSGIDRSFAVDDGGPGRVEKDPATGEPSGILRGATRYVKFRDPRPSPSDAAKLARLETLLRDYAANGLTSVADRNASPEDIERYRELRDGGRLPVRIFANHAVGTIGPVEDVVASIRRVAEHPLARGGDAMLRVGGIKIFLDGGMLTGSAYLREPWGRSAIYSIDDPDYRGVLFVPRERLVPMVDAAVAGGLQFTAHSVGDGAVHGLLDAYEAVSRRRPIRATRPCITHSNFMSAEAVAKMVELGVAADIQPAWLWLDTRTLVAQFGYDRLRWFQPLRSIFAAGGVAGGGSDHMQKIGSLRSVNPYNPFLGMWIAMTRRARWYDGTLHPDEALDRAQALCFYTIQNARILRQEVRSGSIEVGKLADLVVVDRDVLTCALDEVCDTRVLATWLGGRLVSGSEDFAQIGADGVRDVNEDGRDASDGDAQLVVEDIFPPQALHNHSSAIVETPGGDLLVAWYRGSGERTADDVRILGARKRRGASAWSEPFVLADTPGFPDCNPILFLDGRERLWLVWPVIIANLWETALLQAKLSSDFEGDGAPRWEDGRTILLKPGERFAEVVERSIRETKLEGAPRLAGAIAERWFAKIRELAADKYARRMGWMPRARPLLSGGRIVLPLYSDGFDFSLMALSDDDGETWRASEPLVGGGNVQPTLAERADGTIVAWMRDNGLPPERLLASESKDRGETWSRVVDSEIPNPGSGVEVLERRDGRYLLIHNDTEEGRARLSVWMSDDEGRSWKWRRALEPHGDPGGELSASYPSFIEAADGAIHATYTWRVAERGSTIRHAVFRPAWVEGAALPRERN